MDIGKTLDWNGIFAAIIPLYFAIGLGFASVRWWKFFTPEQCNGINRIVISTCHFLPVVLIYFIIFQHYP
ncbi:hypothetical protein TanjilG_12233 [Lupinus angustifolius]|uniref:Uncharacterized protein n=1 Tax=Lupinus angustifolius TaxID=3871 RepID=A0A1J7HZB1_LUPAN|nr:hypothetical protein TanjilG_12233 [Lupinus angustifolius]